MIVWAAEAGANGSSWVDAVKLWADIGASVAVIAGLIFAAHQVWYRHQEAKRVERREEERRVRAHVTARFGRRRAEWPDGQARDDYYFILENRSEAPAFNVSTEMTSVGDDEPPQLLAEDDEFPIPRLDPGAEYPIQMIVVIGSALLVNVDVRWQDAPMPDEDDSTEQHVRLQLRVA